MFTGYWSVFSYCHISNHTLFPKATDPWANFRRDPLQASEGRSFFHILLWDSSIFHGRSQEAPRRFRRRGGCQDRDEDPTSKSLSLWAEIWGWRSSRSSATPRKERLVKNREDRSGTQRFVTGINVVTFLERNISHGNRNLIREGRNVAVAANAGAVPLPFIHRLSLITISSVITQWYHYSFAGKPAFCFAFGSRGFSVWTVCIDILCRKRSRRSGPRFE